jgi:hypothetical protein
MVFNATFNNISVIMWRSVVYLQSSEMALKIPTKCVSLEQTGQHHFDINLTCSRHGIAEELFTWHSLDEHTSIDI